MSDFWKGFLLLASVITVVALLVVFILEMNLL